jgi:hypothetical protein
VSVTAADDPRDGHDWRPVPDPTTLTTEQLRRELSALREILTARLDGMDTATELLSATVNRTPTVIQTEISHVRELMQEKLSSLGGQAEEKFHSIELQFRERDVRTEQAAKAGKEALDAALLSAKELVAQQNEANRGEAGKTEQNFTKQIDAQAARIDELKERIDRGEGSSSGVASAHTERRLDIGQIVAVVAIIIAAISVAAFLLKK